MEPALAVVAAWAVAVPGHAAASKPLAEVIRSGPRNCAQIALTFDLCPVKKPPGWDQPLVEFLIQEHIPATFFPSGRWIERHDAEVKSLLAVPFFEIGSHGARHAHLPALSARRQSAEIRGAVDMLHERYGREPSWFRPPYGEYDTTTLEVARSLGQRVVLWDVVSGDPDPRLSAQRIWREVEASTRPGSVVIFHANGKGIHTREIVERVEKELAPARGLSFVTLSKLMEGCSETAEPRSP